MSFKDIFKKSFLEGYASAEITTPTIVVALGIACVLALYIFFVYRVVTRKTFYSKNFNITLAVITVITAALILTMQSSVVLSLGMVGALSIVRFRTAVKDPGVPVLVHQRWHHLRCRSGPGSSDPVCDHYSGYSGAGCHAGCQGSHDPGGERR